MPAIPPERAAVRAALKTPSRQPTSRVAVMLGAIAAIALVGSFLVPGGVVLPPANTEPPGQRVIGLCKHPVAFRFIVPLAAGRSGKQAELETSITFAYSVAQDDAEKARAAIDAGWPTASAQVGAVLRRHSKLELLDDLPRVNTAIREVLDATLFPDGIAQVERIGWGEMRFR